MTVAYSWCPKETKLMRQLLHGGHQAGQWQLVDHGFKARIDRKIFIKNFAPQISNIPVLSLQHTQRPKNNLIDCYEILVKKQNMGGIAVTRLAF